MAIEGLLMMNGIQSIDRVFNGEEALLKIMENVKRGNCQSDDHQTYKLVILDNKMPILSGIETGKRIRMAQMSQLIPDSI